MTVNLRIAKKTNHRKSGHNQHYTGWCYAAEKKQIVGRPKQVKHNSHVVLQTRSIYKNFLSLFNAALQVLMLKWAIISSNSKQC